MMAVIPVDTGGYQPREVSITTLTNTTNFKGSIAELVGNNRVLLSASDPLQAMGLNGLNDDQRFAIVVKDRGVDVRGNFVERAGVLWPADFHTWNMASTYWNFETAYTYFQEALPTTSPPTELQKMRVMYWPEVRLNSTEPITDNALYLSVIKSFVIVPFDKEKKVPMAMNLGVVGHEVAHRVWGKRVFNDEGIHPALGWSGIHFNLLKSLDEGLADFHGYGVTCLSQARCRTEYLSQSIADEAYAKQRDVARNDACVDENLRSALKTFSPDQWIRARELYLYGNVWAAALYQAGFKSQGEQGVRSIAIDLLSAYNDESSKPGLSQLINRNINNSTAFTPESVTEIIASHISNLQLRRAFCGEAINRLQLECVQTDCFDKAPSCQGASRQTTCKQLPPMP
jgi:hypothetical protein